MTSPRRFTAILATTISPALLLAQQTTESPAHKLRKPSIEAMDSGATLPDTVVTAKTEDRETGYRAVEQTSTGFGSQSILDTPFQITVIPQEVIRDQQARSITEITKNDPSVASAASAPGFYDRVQVRGFYLFNAQRDGLAFNDQAQVPVENKASLEVVKGLAALRYGFISPGGVLNYTLKRPTDERLNRVALFGNGFGGYGVHGDFGGRVGAEGQFGYRINAVAEQEQTYIDEVHGQRYLFSGFFDWKPLDNLRIELEIEHQERDLPEQPSFYNGIFAPGVDELEALSRFDIDTFLGESWATYPTYNTFWSARAEYQFSEDWKLRLAFQRQDLTRDQNAVAPDFGSVQANGDYVAVLFYSPDQERDTIGLQAILDGRFSTGPVNHSLTIGYIFEQSEMTFPDGFFGPIGTSNIYRPRRISDPGVGSDPSYLANRMQNSSFFLSDYVEVTEWLNLFGGLRYIIPDFENFDSSGNTTQRYEEEVLTPSAGIVIKPAPNLSFYASYAEGLEQGGTAPVTAVNANEVMPPIESQQYEFGFKADLWGRATFSSAFFYIDRALEFLDNSNRYVQDGRQVHRGVEATLSGNLTDDLRIIAGLAWLDATIEEANDPILNGQRPQGVPEWQANLFLDYQLSALVPGLFVNTGVYYTGDRPISPDGAIVADSFVRWDLGMRYVTKIAGVTTNFRVNVNNVTDERFFENASFGSYVFGAPRTFLFSAEFQF